MKHLRKFNESTEQDVLNINEIESLNHNFGDDFIEKYEFNEDEVLDIENSWCSGTYQGQKVESHLLLRGREPIGFAVKINGEVEHLISIYEPHGCEINEKKGLITAYGHEQIIHLWLEDHLGYSGTGEFDEIYTR